ALQHGRYADAPGGGLQRGRLGGPSAPRV
ncbi:MAG: hypothetical protein AVDCRST_MAG02-109, partial [uncultured Rubrobacteraceae bacterium]